MSILGMMGRPKKFKEEDIVRLKSLRAEGLTYLQIANKYGCAYSVVWNACNPDRLKKQPHRNNKHKFETYI